MKLYVFIGFILCSLVCHRICSQNIPNSRKAQPLLKDSSIQLKGYYVRRFEKNKIAGIERNRKNRLQGKSFKILIDAELGEDFFFPIDEDSINLEKVLYGALYMSKNAIYLYCTRANYSIFNAQFRHETEKVNIDTCLKLNSIKYYTLNKTDSYCYQVFYLSGNWSVGLANTQVQKQLFSKRMKYMDTSYAINVFLLNKIMVLSEVQSAPLKLWREVPGVLDN